MSRVESINNARVESPYSVFGSISKGIAGGALLGYASKYMLPLSSAEMDKEYYHVKSQIRESAKDLKGLPIDAIRALEERTPAQDAFIKMVDSEPDRVLKIADLRKVIKESKLNQEGVKELKNIIAQVNEKSRNSTKHFMRSYNAAVKEMKRPTIAFVTVGAVIGFFAGLAHKVIAGQLD